MTSGKQAVYPLNENMHKGSDDHIQACLNIAIDKSKEINPQHEWRQIDDNRELGNAKLD